MKKSIEKGIQKMNKNGDVEEFLNSFGDMDLKVIKANTKSEISTKPEGSAEKNKLEIYLDILQSIQNRRTISALKKKNIEEKTNFQFSLGNDLENVA